MAGLAVLPLVPLMTVAAALEANLAKLAADRHARNLPLPQTGMDAFKSLIGFDDVERLQEHYDLR